MFDLRSASLLVVLGVGTALGVGCNPSGASTTVPASATSTVVSLRGIDCPDCSDRIVEGLREKPGFYDASFDKVLAEITVQHESAQLSVQDILAVIEAKGYEGIVGPGQGAYIPGHQFAPALDVKVISEKGEGVTLEDHLASGKITVFDFYADWCEPCRDVDAHMERVLARGDVALRKINIVDWDSEAAKEHLRGVSGLPYVVVHGVDGKRVARISGLHLDQLDAAIAKARR